MKKILLLVVLVLVCGGCSLYQLDDIGEQLVEADVPSTDQAALSDDSFLIFYEGQITVSGKYQMLKPDTLLGGILCFYADDETGDLIPRDPDLYGEGIGDTRIPWFCFSDQDEAIEALGVDSSVFSDQSIECISGEATVTVSDYIVNTREAAVYDRATLDEVVDNTGQMNECN